MARQAPAAASKARTAVWVFCLREQFGGQFPEGAGVQLRQFTGLPASTRSYHFRRHFESAPATRKPANFAPALAKC